MKPPFDPGRDLREIERTATLAGALGVLMLLVGVIMFLVALGRAL